MELEGIDHVALGVRDIEQSANWYIEVLGFGQDLLRARRVVDKPVLPLTGIAVLADWRVKRGVAAKSAVHLDDIPLGDTDAFHNHYKNSVLLQERTVSSFLRDLKALPPYARQLVDHLRAERREIT